MTTRIQIIFINHKVKAQDSELIRELIFEDNQNQKLSYPNCSSPPRLKQDL